MPNRTPHILAALALAVAAAGCGGDDGGGARDAPAAATPSAAGPFGTYVRRVTGADLARTRELRSEAGPAQSAPPRGRYTLTIAKGSAQAVLKATDPDGFTIDMDVDVRGDQLVTTSYVDPSRASFCGPEMPVTSTYRFTAGDGSLALAPAKPDGCADRDSILTGTWTSG